MIPKRGVSPHARRPPLPGRAVGWIAECVLVGVAGCVLTGPDGTILTGEVDVAPIDVWTGAHALSGYILGDRLGDDSFAPTMAVLVAWELIEPHVWSGWHETATNQTIDVVAGAGGWMVTR